MEYIKQTEMMFQPSPSTGDHHQSIQISGEDLVIVKEFKYQGSRATYNYKVDTELQLRKSKKLLKHLGVSKIQPGPIETKRAVYCAIVLSTQLYGAEPWPVYMTQAHSLNDYMMRHRRQILDVKWWYHIPNQDILMKTNMPSMYETLIYCNLRWAGHLARQDSAAKANSLSPAQGRAPKHWQAKLIKIVIPGAQSTTDDTSNIFSKSLLNRHST